MLTDEQQSEIWNDLVKLNYATEQELALVTECFFGNVKSALDKVVYIRTMFSDAEDYFNKCLNRKQDIKGSYETRIAVVDLDVLENYCNKEGIDYHDDSISNGTDDDNFYETAEKLGTVFTLGGFAKCINNGYFDGNFNKIYLRVFLVNLDNPQSSLILVNDTLTLKDGNLTDERFFKEYDY